MAARQRSYLDYNASAPVRPEAAAAMSAALALPGNPSSVHAEGRAARALVEQAREQVARLVGAKPSQVVFTSSGSEAAALALRPGLAAGGRASTERLLMSAVEHPCVLDGHGFGEAERIPVDSDGVVNLDWLSERLDQDASGLLVSIQAANNETGVLQPVAAAADLVRGHGGVIHTDAVQVAGRLPLSIGDFDAITFSAHKIGGPKGVGALVLGDGVVPPSALLRGGGQERGRRAGTENVAGIAGFGAAAEAANAESVGEASRLLALRKEVEAHLRRLVPDVHIFGVRAERLPNTVAFSAPGLKAETLLIAFDLEGVALSSGAACSSGKVRRSHVLEACGVSAGLADGAIRVSLGWNSTQEDVSWFAGACERVFSSLYKRQASAA
ncbi:cysteine desulfurase family protein [Microvirga massiliensis]|uniref:cysteine desulfurase family protein n=1 Tax=Microvirga massiliensis TaxID=1033741 RepID=UPI00062BA3A8|nr:cysteine desulfurase family protein [Microvirga massiliensis]